MGRTQCSDCCWAYAGATLLRVLMSKFIISEFLLDTMYEHEKVKDTLISDAGLNNNTGFGYGLTDNLTAETILNFLDRESPEVNWYIRVLDFNQAHISIQCGVPVLISIKDWSEEGAHVVVGLQTEGEKILFKNSHGELELSELYEGGKYKDIIYYCFYCNQHDTFISYFGNTHKKREDELNKLEIPSENRLAKMLNNIRYNF